MRELYQRVLQLTRHPREAVPPNRALDTGLAKNGDTALARVRREQRSSGTEARDVNRASTTVLVGAQHGAHFGVNRLLSVRCRTA